MKRASFLVVASLTALLGGAGNAVAQAPRAASPADLVVLDGKIFTADKRSSVAQGFAVKDGHFLAVGNDVAMHAFIGKATTVIDLHGRFVSPGLADGHFHNEGGGPGIDLSQTRTLGELLATVAAAAQKAQPGDVIVSNADWHEAQLKEKRLPLATELDKVAPNNPVVLVRGGHEMILNTAALKKSNITRDTPSPDGGEISKGKDGEPTGEIFDNAKQLVQLPPSPPVTIDDILKTERTLNAYGITSARIPGAYRGNLFADYNCLSKCMIQASLRRASSSTSRALARAIPPRSTT